MVMEEDLFKCLVIGDFSSCESPSEPPEAHIDDECEEEHRHSCYLGVRGASVEVFGICAVLLRQGTQVAGFCV